MSPHEHELQQEQQLLEHFRQHSQGEPSAALDALILDAARQALSARPSRAQRLHAWLFGAGSHVRWSVAFAGLATLGIGLSLTLNTREQLPRLYDEPSPATLQAPMLREMAPMISEQAVPTDASELDQAERKRSVADSSAAFSVSPPAAAMPRQAAPAKPAAPPAEEALAQTEAAAPARLQTQKAQESARRAPARLADGLAKELAPLDERLREVLRLRQEGQQALAEQLLQHLVGAYPQQDARAQLKRMEQGQN